MSPVGKKPNGGGNELVLVLLLVPFISMIVLSANGERVSPANLIGSPPAVTETNSTQSTAIDEHLQTANANFLEAYGEHIYPVLQEMPAEMLSWYLTWIHRVSQFYEVPEEDILTIHYAELLGAGFNPLETRRSSAGAGGPGQIIPQTWNGWTCGSDQSVFMTDPVSISACGGLGRDFDDDGIASVDSLPDNLAATARYLQGLGITLALRMDPASHEALLRDALALYNSNNVYALAPQDTKNYADIGINWWRQNWQLIPVYLSIYTPES